MENVIVLVHTFRKPVTLFSTPSESVAYLRSVLKTRKLTAYQILSILHCGARVMAITPAKFDVKKIGSNKGEQMGALY